MFSLFRSLSLRYLARHRARSLLVVLSIALGVGTWVATSLLNRTLGRSIRSGNMPLAGAADFHVTNNTVRSVDVRLAERLRKVAGVKRVQPLTLETVKIEPAEPPSPGDQRKPHTVTLVGVGLSGGETSREQVTEDLRQWGIDIDEADLNAYVLAAGAYRISPTWFPPPALVGQRVDVEVLKGNPKFQLHSGGKTQGMRRAGQVRASGTASSLGGYVLLMDSETAGSLLGMTGRVTRLDVTLEPGADRQRVEHELRKELAGSGADLQSPQANDQRLQDVLKGLEVAFQFSGKGALVVGLFLVYNALSVSVAERRHDIGILRSVGATRGQVRLLFLAEALGMGLVGTLIGLPLGVVLAHASLGPLQKVLRGVILPVDMHRIDLAPEPFVGAVLAGMTVSLLAALIPASQAAAEEPADAVRRAPVVPLLIYRVLHITGSVLLVLTGLVLVAVKPHLAPEALRETGLHVDDFTYAGIQLLLVGGLLSTPILGAVLTRLIQPLGRWCLPVEGRLAMDNLVRAPLRTGLVIGALAAGVALTLQTAGMIRSNEAALTEWLDETVQADLYISAGGPISTSSEITAMDTGTMKDLRDLLPPDSKVVGTCYRIVDWDDAAGGTKVFLTLIDASAHYQANADKPGAPRHLDSYRRLGQERGTAIVSENFALRYRKRVGDLIELNGADGPVTLRIIDVVVDYTWNRGTIIVDRQGHLDVFKADRVDCFDVYCPPGADVARARDRVQQSEAGARHALFAMTRDEVQGHILAFVRRMYSVGYTQNLLLGLVAVLGVVMAMLISVLGRRRELGLLRAVGGTPGQVLHTVLAEAVLIGAVGTILGVLIGLPLEWYVVRVVIFDESGFLFPVRIPWLATALIAALAVLSATLAGIGPAIQATRLRIADAIAYE